MINYPTDFDASVEQSLAQIVDEQFDGSLERLKTATLDEQTDAWYAVFDAAEVEPPPRLTCVLVTLTDLAKDNLSYALGRGVMGQPRGRLLQLAEESGVRPPAPPSMAPPPFNRREPETIAGDAAAADGWSSGRQHGDRRGRHGHARAFGRLQRLDWDRAVVLLLRQHQDHDHDLHRRRHFGDVEHGHGLVDLGTSRRNPDEHAVVGLCARTFRGHPCRQLLPRRGPGAGPDGAAGRAIRHAVLPCTLASVTTAIGLISLVHQQPGADQQLWPVFGHWRDRDAGRFVFLFAGRAADIRSHL